MPTQEEPEPEHFEVFEENWDAVNLFLACSTCWRRTIVPMSAAIIWEGLRYPDVEVVIRAHGHRGKKAGELFQQIQLIESGALPELQKQANKK